MCMASVVVLLEAFPTLQPRRVNEQWLRDVSRDQDLCDPHDYLLTGDLRGTASGRPIRSHSRLDGLYKQQVGTRPEYIRGYDDGPSMSREGGVNPASKAPRTDQSVPRATYITTMTPFPGYRSTVPSCRRFARYLNALNLRTDRFSGRWADAGPLLQRNGVRREDGRGTTEVIFWERRHRLCIGKGTGQI